MLKQIKDNNDRKFIKSAANSFEYFSHFGYVFIKGAVREVSM